MANSRERFFERGSDGKVRLCGEYDQASGTITFFRRSRTLANRLQAESETISLVSQLEENEPSCWALFISTLCGTENEQSSPNLSSDSSSEDLFFYQGKK